MQTHPIPSAHVCTTLPPGDLPMQDICPHTTYTELIAIGSQCGKVKRSFFRQLHVRYPQAPIGTWATVESRTDNDGEVWFKQDQGVYYVVDDFGFLARVDGKGGAA